MKLRHLLSFIVFCAFTYDAVAYPGPSDNLSSPNNLITISPAEALAIGVKIWYNECAGTVSGLTTWNRGENFASLGIGHFIWYPAGRPHVYSQSFPALLRFMEKRGVTVPRWLQVTGDIDCPWNNRFEFEMAQNSPEMVELRSFLLRTIPLQTEFMIDRMENGLPKMLASLPPEDQPYIEAQFYHMAATPIGVYALVDYVNFKGLGVTSYGFYDSQGWGLLEVLENMKYAPRNLTELQAFVWSANQVLTRRVMNEPPYRHDWLWLTGWRNRLHTYLEKDTSDMEVGLQDSVEY